MTDTGIAIKDLFDECKSLYHENATLKARNEAICRAMLVQYAGGMVLRWATAMPGGEKAGGAMITESNKYAACPLKAAGFRLVSFAELPTIVIGSDGKCICTVTDRCLDVDKRDGMRCTLKHLDQIDREAQVRRGIQSGDGQ